MKKMICIMCPMGCALEVDEKNGNLTVSGNICPRGAKYANSEYYHPERMVTALINLNNGRVAPVKTDRPVPKNMIFEVLKEIGAVRCNVPVRIGDRVLHNVCGTGADIVVTKNIDA